MLKLQYNSKFIAYNLPAFAWMMLILLIIAMPGSSLPITDFWSLLKFDKFVHLAIFAILVFLLLIGFNKQNTIPKLKIEASFYAIWIGFAYSGLTEILQGLLFTQRTADVFDFIANCIGCLCGTLIFYLIYKI